MYKWKQHRPTKSFFIIILKKKEEEEESSTFWVLE